MKASIISIGNSKGIIIPSVLLKECNIEGSVELIREDDRIVIKPVKTSKRKGWDVAFKKMHSNGDDSLLLDDSLDLDTENWQWK